MFRMKYKNYTTYSFIVCAGVPEDYEDVPGDGNCMFSSLSLQLGRSMDMHPTTRKEIVDYMRMEKELVRNVLVIVSIFTKKIYTET